MMQVAQDRGKTISVPNWPAQHRTTGMRCQPLTYFDTLRFAQKGAHDSTMTCF